VDFRIPAFSTGFHVSKPGNINNGILYALRVNFQAIQIVSLKFYLHRGFETEQGRPGKIIFQGGNLLNLGADTLHHLSFSFMQDSGLQNSQGLANIFTLLHSRDSGLVSGTHNSIETRDIRIIR